METSVSLLATTLVRSDRGDCHNDRMDSPEVLYKHTACAAQTISPKDFADLSSCITTKIHICGFA